jgi:hypothetical protein
MSNNPLNLVLRFLLELFALGSIGYWSWTNFSGVFQYIFVVLFPVCTAAVWGLFRTPGEPFAHQKVVVPVKGFVRFTIEILFFGFACWGLFNSNVGTTGYIFTAIVSIHYLISYNRIIRLLKN